MAVQIMSIANEASTKIEEINKKAKGILTEIESLENDSKNTPKNKQANDTKIEELTTTLEILGNNIEQINNVLDATYDSIDKNISHSITITKL